MLEKIRSRRESHGSGPRGLDDTPPSPGLVTVNPAGAGLTTTFVLPALEGHPLTATVTKYVPASAVVTFVRVGFCAVEVKPFGPVHA